MRAPWCTSVDPCPQADSLLHGRLRSLPPLQSEAVPVHTMPMCASPAVHIHGHTGAQPYMGTEAQVPAGVSPLILASAHGCPSQAQPQGGRLHDRGMQTSGDALPADVRERPRGNHMGRNPGRRARPRRGPRVLGTVQGVGHMQTLAPVSPVTLCP